MIKRIAISSTILLFCIVLQSTLLRYVAIYEVIPNIYLIYLVFTSFNNGGLHGTACGFITGLIEDTISVSPLGFHSIIKTIIGTLYSTFNGLVALDNFLMPMALVFSATVMNRIIAFVVVSLFHLSIPVHSVFSRFFLIEIAYNTLLTPLVFFIARKIRSLVYPRRYGE